MNNYYVYIGRVKDNIVYIGKGKGSRLNHLTSGKSHCKEANDHISKGGALDVGIYRDSLTKMEALEIERSLIISHSPCWNKTIPTITEVAQYDYDVCDINISIPSEMLYDKNVPKTSLRLYLHMCYLYTIGDSDSLCRYKTEMFSCLKFSKNSLKEGLEYLDREGYIDIWKSDRGAILVTLSKTSRAQLNFSNENFDKIFIKSCHNRGTYDISFSTGVYSISVDIAVQVTNVDYFVEEVQFTSRGEQIRSRLYDPKTKKVIL